MVPIVELRYVYHRDGPATSSIRCRVDRLDTLSCVRAAARRSNWYASDAAGVGTASGGGIAGLLALGPLRAELVTSASRNNALGVDDTERPDVPAHCGLRGSGVGDRVRHGAPERREGRHQRPFRQT
jgi:hypothetical protein